MKTYRRHYCARRHKTYRTLAQCLWPRAVWITGNGPYATLARCGRALTVQLHPTADAAQVARRVIDSSGCGGSCPCTGAGHETVRLLDPADTETTR